MAKKDNQIHFKATIKLCKDKDATCNIEFDVDGKKETDLLMDDVHDKMYDALDSVIGYDTCPDASALEIFIKKGKAWYPVVDEDNKKKMEELKKSKAYKKFLILPWARYSLSEKGIAIKTLTDSGLFTFEQLESMPKEKLKNLVDNLTKAAKSLL